MDDVLGKSVAVVPIQVVTGETCEPPRKASARDSKRWRLKQGITRVTEEFKKRRQQVSLEKRKAADYRATIWLRVQVASQQRGLDSATGLQRFLRKRSTTGLINMPSTTAVDWRIQGRIDTPDSPNTSIVLNLL